MQDLLKKYYDVKLAKYKTRLDARGALVAAQYALDDMLNVVKGYKRDCVYSDDQICEVLKMEIEDVQRAMA